MPVSPILQCCLLLYLSDQLLGNFVRTFRLHAFCHNLDTHDSGILNEQYNCVHYELVAPLQVHMLYLCLQQQHCLAAIWQHNSLAKGVHCPLI